MNLKQLKYFCQIVESGSAALAAEQLFIAPTAISMQLSQLEALLGAELFDRSKRPMELTSLGRYLYPRAKEQLRQLSRLEAETKDVASGKRGWLSIGFTRSTIVSLLPEALRLFRESHPNVHLELVEALSEYQIDHLKNSKIDIGISRFIGNRTAQAEFDETILIKEPFVVALPIGHHLAKKETLTLEELSAIPLITYPKDIKTNFNQLMASTIHSTGNYVPVAYEAVEIHTALGLVGAGLGMTFVGHSVAKNNRTDVAFISVANFPISTTVVAYTRKNEINPLVNKFLLILKKVSLQY
ncbi:LysR family transcriptional regulator [Zophobihabitans entericus]|uniref:LysR family transcriptional regulator n=1 Tax=Zophobihabitans entericus TaxID=1635327 RepID=A0A6G9IBM7_9GAMM|nr:LysR family transcriptional regulator [Zophobihabitans entericus]QIQ21631.1 LysR family transcriptional regulator [Zophobihabitans entericus]